MVGGGGGFAENGECLNLPRSHFSPSERKTCPRNLSWGACALGPRRGSLGMHIRDSCRGRTTVQNWGAQVRGGLGHIRTPQPYPALPACPRSPRRAPRPGVAPGAAELASREPPAPWLQKGLWPVFPVPWPSHFCLRSLRMKGHSTGEVLEHHPPRGRLWTKGNCF